MATLIGQSRPAQLHDKSLKIMAKSIFKELKENGYDTRHIVSLSTELISLVTSDLRAENSVPATPQQ
jgi:hypothetical protein